MPVFQTEQPVPDLLPHSLPRQPRTRRPWIPASKRPGSPRTGRGNCFAAGVVFRDLLAREEGSPCWFDLLQVLRRLEARGEIRGGRFIAGVAGEQFALADSVQQLRRLRDEGATQELIVISAADPLNLVGIVTRQERVPRTASNRVAYLDGVPVASLQGGEVHWLGQPSREAMQAILNRLRQPSLLPTEVATKSDIRACLQNS